MAELLKPEDDDYFVIKPKHSGFFSTTLETLLSHLKVKRLILTGIQTDICVLFTANDAYMRDYLLYVPSDCSAAENDKDHHYAFKKMKNLLKADLTPSTAFGFDCFKKED
nr:isochorismatase family cysteine hydrolase [Bacillus taeanensis]